MLRAALMVTIIAVFSASVAFAGSQCPGKASGAGPFDGIAVTFDSVQPMMTNGILMVPLRPVLDATKTAFVYDPEANMIAFNTNVGTVVHEVGTNWLMLSRCPRKLSARSSMMCNVIYVPQDAIQIVTGRSVNWNPDSGVLQLQ